MVNRKFKFKVALSKFYWGICWHIIESKGRGVVELQIDNNFPENGYICELNVVDFERNKGIGNALMDSVEDMISELGLNAVLDVEKEKEWIVKWYEKRGYEIVPFDYQDEEMNEKLYRMIKKL